VVTEQGVLVEVIDLRVLFVKLEQDVLKVITAVFNINYLCLHSRNTNQRKKGTIPVIV